MQRSRIIMLAVLLPALLGAAALGQDAPAVSENRPAAAAAEPPLAPASDAPPVRELAPELYYLKDESGRLVPVPGFGYRDFLELFRIKEGLGGPALPPAAILESVVVRIDARRLGDDKAATAADPAGSAGAGPAACPVEVSIRVRQSRGGWAMVPLGLGRVLLDAPPRHEGPGRLLVDVDPDAGGYRCWFESPPDAGSDLEHIVTLTGRLPVARGADREAFEIRLPAAVASRVELQTSRPQPAVDVVPATARADATAAEGGSLVTITGLTGDARIRLGTEAAAAAATVATEAECRSVVRIDGRSARTTASLQVTNLPPGTQQLQVRLPAGAGVQRVSGDGSLLGDGSPRPDRAAERDDTAAETVALAVDPRSDGSAVLELACERPVDASGKTPLDPLGFAIAGIEPWRQRGRISLVIEGDWQATWDDVPGVRRIDPPADEREPGLTAAFAYDAQPAALPLRIRPRRSRVVIEPEYRYEVSAARITLAARLRVAVRGAPIGSLTLGLDPAWSLAEVGPAGFVDSAGVRSEAGRVTIPFLQPLVGDAVVELEAARDIDPTAEAVAWSLPVPRADLVGPAAVVIVADSNIELLPDVAATVGLVRQTSSTLRSDAADGVALAYRLDAPEGRFAATRKFLPRRVEAVVVGRVAVDEREIRVSETIRLEVLHVPLEFLELTLPAAVVESGSLEIRQLGEPLSGLEVSPLDETDSADRPLVVARVFLPRPLLGRGEVVVSYREAAPEIPAEATAAVDLALPLPAAAAAIRQSVVIEDSATLAIVPRGDSWRREFTGAAGGGRSWSSAKPRGVLPLAISARTREAAGVTVIEAAWLRTRLFPASREDTATFVVQPAEDQLQIRLPAAATSDTVEARLDGSPVSLEPRGDGTYTLEIAPPGRGSRLVEIRTVGPWGGTWFGLGLPWPLPLEPPAFAAGVIERRFCWEVGLLPGDHLAGLPGRWTSQQQWLWDGLGWKRQPSVASAELADWIAATLGRPAVAVTAPGWPVLEGRSVYAGLGSPGTAAAWVIPTWFTVLVASGLALAIGLAMVFAPTWRRPPVVVGLLAAAAVLWAAVPTLGPLVAQAALPGAGLAALAALLQRLTGPGPTRRFSPPAGPASSLTRSAVPTVSLIVSSPEPGSTASARRGAS